MQNRFYLGVSLAVVGSCTATMPDRITHYYTPAGYVEMANALIKRRLVVYDCDHDRIVARIPDGTPEYSWYQDSYLKSDIDQFNDAQQRFSDLFLIEGCVLVGVNPTAHVVPLPETSGALRQWDGSLRYSSQHVVGTLRSNRQMLTILAPTGVLETSDVAVVPVEAGVPGAYASDAVIKLFFRRPEREAADVYAVGSTGVLRDRRDAAIVTDHDIRVGGRSLPQGRIVALQNRDWIQFVERAGTGETRTTYQYYSGDLASIISWAGLRNTSIVRVTAANTLGFVGDLVRGLNSTYQSIREEGGRAIEQFDIELTVARDLQHQTTSRLERFVEATLPDRTYPRRAAVTLMDAFTGNSLALGTYPSRPAQLSQFPYLSTGERRRLLSNQNLNRHPIGSAGKPFLMNAVLSEYPYMAGFTVPGHVGSARYPTAAGHPLDTGYETHNHPQPVGIVRGLGVSCNKLIVDLLTASLALDPKSRGRDRIGRVSDVIRTNGAPMPAGDRFQTCGSAAQEVPLLPSHQVNANKLWKLDENTIFTRFADQTGVRIYAELAPEAIAASEAEAGNTTFDRAYQASRFHIRPWDEVLAKLIPLLQTKERRTNALKAIGSASPEAVNLSMNTVDQFRAEWINVLLGGATASWNNVQLGEAMSRLVTGRDVRAAFVPRTGAPVRPELQRNLDERARRLILAGLSEVTSTAGGTASALAGFERRLAAQFPGFTAHVFGKTGTPAVQGFVPRPQMRLIASLFNAGVGGRGAIYYDPTARRVVLTTAGDQLLAKANPQIAARVRTILDDMNARIDHYQVPADDPPPNAFPLYVRDDVLKFNDRARSAWNSKGAVFVGTVLLTPAGTSLAGPVPSCLPDYLGNLTRIPTAVAMQAGAVGVTIVVYLEDVPGTSATAVGLVRTLEPEIINALKTRLDAARRVLR